MEPIHARVATFGVVAAQIAAGVALAAWLAVSGDTQAGYSALVGTLAGAMPNYFFALRLSHLTKDAEPREQLRTIYIGETIKIVFASAVLASAIAFLDVRLAYLIAGFLVTVVVSWLALKAPLPGESR